MYALIGSEAKARKKVESSLRSQPQEAQHGNRRILIEIPYLYVCTHAAAYAQRLHAFVFNLSYAFA